jgi:hypothetical protein
MRQYLAGVSVAAFGRGNRRIIAAVKARGTVAPPDPCAHPDHKKPSHAEHCASHPAPSVATDEPHPFKVWAWRLGGTAAALFFLWPLVGKWVPTTLAATVTVWALAALIAGQEGAPAAAGSTEASSPTELAGTALDDEEWIQAAPAPDALWALIRHTAGLTKQRTAAHLQAVLEEGVKRGQFDAWTVTDLADELAALGVPVVDGKKLTVGGRDRNRMAVLLADLPQADPAPVPAVLQGRPSAVAQSAA